MLGGIACSSCQHGAWKGHASAACEQGYVLGCAEACPSQGSVATDADGATLILLHSRAASKATALRLMPQAGPDGAAPPSRTTVEVGVHACGCPQLACDITALSPKLRDQAHPSHTQYMWYANAWRKACKACAY